ncbi:MAG: methyltransferase [Candidatus Marinimicrobia bacterium]|jgi:hypothetical protein|nr:methyltransferase [Candidatus Neomarinimicrobiota bacterium]MBT7900810.1 methyltransferase [Candidatus Neomarinimicrobiota bacterium]
MSKLKKINQNSSYALNHELRFHKSFNFLKKIIQPTKRILDLGPENPLSILIRNNGYEIENTPDNLDLDLNYKIVKNKNYDVITAFEILEHLVSPFPLLKNIQAQELIVSVPLKLWFANAYWNENDPFDCHYHEFESRQLEMLLNKANWEIIKSEKWISPSNKIGFRPLIRKFTPRYYIVYCRRSP